MPRPRRATAESRLSAEAWEIAALDALAEAGLAAVAIEPLARRLGVTKGSFYWHFPDRDALLAAVLRRWEQSFTDRIIAAVNELPAPRERLERLITSVLSGGRHDRIHIALAVSPHPLVREALARVTHRRIEYLESCYLALGQSRSEARQSALLAYAAYVGFVHLRLEAPRSLPAKRVFAAGVKRLIAMLAPE